MATSDDDVTPVAGRWFEGEVDVPAPDGGPPLTGDAARTLAFRRSRRASRERRRIAATRRRRLFEGRGAALAATVAMVALSAGAVAQQGGPGSSSSSDSVVVAVQKALNVAADGVVGPQTRGAVRRFQREHGLVVDGIIGPRTLRALGLSAAASATSGAASGAAASMLARIASCESGGDPGAVSADGRYRGKYQFSRETWRAMGGRGDPADAPEAVQDAMAARLLAQAGTSPWPSCA